MRAVRLAAALAVGLGWSAASAQTAPTPQELARAQAILRASPVFDGHNDLPWAIRDGHGSKLASVDLLGDTRRETPPLHTDIPRLRAGRVGAQWWSVYVPHDIGGPEAIQAVFEQIDIVHQLVARHPEVFRMATTADEVVAAQRAGRIASLMGAEGGHAIDDSLGVLRALHRAGVRYMTLTHSRTINWVDSATDAPRHGGLSPFGEEVVREMNRLGMLVDISHVSADAMRDAMRVSEAPVIFSHSSVRGVTDHPRNAPDDVLRELRNDGGLIMITFVPGFVSERVRAWSAAGAAEDARLKSLHPGDAAAVRAGLEAWRAANPRPNATLSDVADHLDHARRTAGADHIGLGGDFDGIDTTVQGLDGVEDYPALIAELLRRGWSEADLRKLTGGNMLRVMRQAEAVAARLQRARPASTATIAELQPTAAAVPAR